MNILGIPSLIRSDLDSVFDVWLLSASFKTVFEIFCEHKGNCTDCCPESYTREQAPVYDSS